ncbi:MAG: CYTH domain-containing protein [Candidatus Woesearchaeota archaeon]
MIELEKTFLLRYIPDLSGCEYTEVIDTYFPLTRHPVLRLRKSDKYQLTKKTSIDGDASIQEEQTINLSPEEYLALSDIKGKKLRKIRYRYHYKGHVAEIDVFKDALEGLALVDFEFATEEEKSAFEIPDFCLADVTHEDFIAGGMLCGKTYADIEKELSCFGYRPLFD